ncbi:TIGR00730 family Rossman fold protein [Demequina activiva]|uniref:Nudix hydrolase domain-containing protein n=1 Tax=Demequina activiva TaxID=1582364 RepID=A0A919Q4W1_9MICO|nr:TIGR00730 family Rossman fold protein [Demequina activiva]GIG54333.1 hypothetical protein Dac01nite_10850 [Demequina activiva]
MTLKRVCVFAGSSPGADPRFMESATALGTLLASRGIGVVFGGGSVGLMGAVADAALKAGGEVIGVIPEALDRREVSHRGVTQLHVVDTMHERKAMMADLSDAFIALPGGLGTFEEVLEVTTWTQLGFHDKPVGLLSVAGFYDDLKQLLDHAVRQRFIRPEHRALLLTEDDAEGLLERLEAWQPLAIDKWMDAGLPELDVPPRGPLVGTSAVVVRDGKVLLGRRRGSHGAGTWSFPGGKVAPGEAPADAAARELEEETGLMATSVEPITWTDDVFPEHGLHYVTLHYAVEAEGEPVTTEPDKIDEWAWFDWDTLPQPLFGPVAALVATGWNPGS